MNGFKTTTAILLALAAYTLLANPARAQTVNADAWPPMGCTGDFQCDVAPATTTASASRTVTEPQGGERTQTVAKVNAEPQDVPGTPKQ